MLRRQDGPGSIRVVLIATSEFSQSIRLVQHCFFLRCDCYVFAYMAFKNGFIASCSKHSNKTIAKSNDSKNIAMEQNKEAMLRKPDGPGSIRVVLIDTSDCSQGIRLAQHCFCSKV